VALVLQCEDKTKPQSEARFVTNGIWVNGSLYCRI